VWIPDPVGIQRSIQRAGGRLLHKPFGYGLSAEFAYTYSQLKDDMDSSGWGEQFGSVYYQDAYNPSANYAPSNFNRPNSVKGALVYAVPLGKGRQYLNSAAGDAALGGWQVSTSFIAESGAPFTVIMNSATQSHRSWRLRWPRRISPDP
jgi:hypothetical protein